MLSPMVRDQKTGKTRDFFDALLEWQGVRQAQEQVEEAEGRVHYTLGGKRVVTEASQQAGVL